MTANLFGLFDKPAIYKGQNYNRIKEQLLEDRTLFLDHEFPPNLTSIFSSLSNYDLTQNEELNNIRWKRPTQICENPYLFVNGVSTNDVLQGRLGNCWFVAACTCITVYRENWMMLIPDYKSQEWSTDNRDDYAGIFKFRFWKYGLWTEVVIDDLLPTLDNDLIYCHSNYRNEFWSALLEKAYAKLLGSYEALEGGELIESLVDFTGGLAEPIVITEEFVKSEKYNKLFQYLLKEYGNKSLIAAAIPAMTPEEQEEETSMGLIIGHAYAVTMVIDLPVDVSKTDLKLVHSKVQNGHLKMVRLRNPWGQGEWKGPFCDGSLEWDVVSKSSRHRVGLTFQDDGEFWMTFNDFVNNYKSVVICHQINNIFNKFFYEYVYHNSWSKDLSGGCLNFKSSFLHNPQYTFEIDSEEGEEVQFCLTQKMIRELNRNGGATGLVHIGYSILKIEANRQYRVHRLDHCVLEQSSAFKNGRSIFLRIHLKRGKYLAVPCTFQPGQVQSFMFRIYCRAQINTTELVQSSPISGLVNYLVKVPEVATRISIFKATALPRLDPIHGANPFFVLLCENQKCTSSICNSTLDPEWDESFIFYRRYSTREPIVLLVYSRSGILNEFIGKQVFEGINKEENQVLEFKLLGKRNDFHTYGSVFVQYKTFPVTEYNMI